MHIGIIEVEVKPELVAKVAEMRANNEENLEFANQIGKALGEEVFHSTRLVKNGIPCLRKSLAENHSADEVEEIISNLSLSSDHRSPLIRCLMALVGIKPRDEDSDE